MKDIDKEINFVREKAFSYYENSLLSIFKYYQSKVSFNKSINNHINLERIYNQPYNKRKN